MISFDNYQMAAFEVLNGLDQIDPYLGICCLRYNSDLTKITVLKVGEWLLLFVDNAVIIIYSKDFNETHEKLCNIMQQSGGVFD